MPGAPYSITSLVPKISCVQALFGGLTEVVVLDPPCHIMAPKKHLFVYFKTKKKVGL